MPKEKRDEKKLEIQRAHFSLGSDKDSKLLLFDRFKEMPSNSYGQSHLKQTVGQTVHDATVQNQELKDRHDAVQKSRASHFHLNYASKGTATANYMGIKAQSAVQ